jgi:hypothetical protein
VRLRQVDIINKIGDKELHCFALPLIKFYGLSYGILIVERHRQKPIMKKRTLVAVALLASSMAFAQQKKEKQAPPPPPPPVVDVVHVPPPPAPPPPPEKPNEEYNVFLKQHPEVKGIAWSNDAVRIHLKSGKEEVYDMKNETEVKKLRETYGELPTPPPPPPPPKPVKTKTVS